MCIGFLVERWLSPNLLGCGEAGEAFGLLFYGHYASHQGEVPWEGAYVLVASGFFGCGEYDGVGFAWT